MNWPDFDGRVVVIAASGPSQREDDLAALQGEDVDVIAISETWRLAPWARCLYACDPDWWALREPAPDAFDGQRLIGYGQRAGCTPCRVQPHAEMLWDGERLGGGANSGYQALNLAAVMGAARVVLTGFDCKGPGEHWHGRHAAPLRQTNALCVARWIDYFDAAAPVLAERGVEVLNATRDTALTCFPRASLPEAIKI